MSRVALNNNMETFRRLLSAITEEREKTAGERIRVVTPPFKINSVDPLHFERFRISA